MSVEKVEEAQKKKKRIIVRVSLASGLLTGKMNNDTAFEKNDHRYYNRHGEAFDVGETFAGVPFNIGLEAVGELISKDVMVQVKGIYEEFIKKYVHDRW